jgi:hypothetical protein
VSAPVRIQRSRTRGWRAPAGAVYVGRGTRWGNPWRVVREPVTGGWHVHREGQDGVGIGTWPTADAARPLAVQLYEHWAMHAVGFAAQVRAELAGRDLMCWCPLPAPGQPDHCHAAVLLRIANGGAA